MKTQPTLTKVQLVKNPFVQEAALAHLNVCVRHDGITDEFGNECADVLDKCFAAMRLAQPSDADAIDVVMEAVFALSDNMNAALQKRGLLHSAPHRAHSRLDSRLEQD